MNGRVLVVDDEQSLRGLIRGILEQEGLVAESAESVDEALEKLGRVSYDLVLVDVVLEEGSGLDVLAGVRDAGVAAQTNPQTPVVIVTAAPALESAIQAVRLGAFDYVVKPVRRAQLLAVAGRALDHKTLVDHKARLEESLRTRERNFAILLDSIEDTVLLVDASGRIQLANQAAATRMGREPAELVGRTMTELDLPPQLVASRMEWLRRVVNLGRPAYFEDERPPYLFDISMFPAPGSGGSVERVAVVARDVTQARRDKADLAEARQDRADMAVRLKSLEERLQSRRGLGSLVGGSPAMEEVFARIGQAAVVDSAVLVTGEAGTGRELVAAVIHQAGPRSVGPLERVDCSVM
ncbi:MAG: response regulator, partial [Proteobacteria bacterium]|nr:response regulator [Pseudomonadota bacterium]